MARLPYLELEDLADEDRKLLARPIALAKLLAHSPGGARAFSRLGGYIRSGSTLDPRLREMAILQVGWTTRSPYEFSHHVKLGLEQFGVAPDDIHAIAAESRGETSGLPPLDRAVLQAAREMTTDLEVSADAFDVLRSELSTEHVLDLLLATSFYCGVVRVLASLQIDVEPEYETYLEQFPFPEGPA